MTVWFLLSEGDHDDELDWPVSTTAIMSRLALVIGERLSVINIMG